MMSLGFVVCSVCVVWCREGSGCVDRCVGALVVLWYSRFVDRAAGVGGRPSGACVCSLERCKGFYLLGVCRPFPRALVVLLGCWAPLPASLSGR